MRDCLASGEWKSKAECARKNHQALGIENYDTAYDYLKGKDCLNPYEKKPKKK
jgi:hypothetical protein